MFVPYKNLWLHCDLAKNPYLKIVEDRHSSLGKSGKCNAKGAFSGDLNLKCLFWFWVLYAYSESKV